MKLNKLSMEIMYVPVASNDEKRNMMTDWRTTSGRATKYSLLCAACEILISIFLLREKYGFWYIPLAVAAILSLSALLTRKWLLSGYTCVILGTLLGCSGLLAPLPDEVFLAAAVTVGAFLPLLPSVFAFRCMYNYNDVFLELKKFEGEGFPDFIRNTGDLYGEKIYIREEDESQYDGKFKSSYNPFYTQADYYREEFLRSQNTKNRKPSKAKVLNIDTNKDNVNRSEESNKRYREIFGYEWIICHEDLDTATREQRKSVADKWRENTQLFERDYMISVFFMMLIIMAGNLGSFEGMLNYLDVILFTFGITSTKLNNPVGPAIVIGSILYLTVFTGHFLILGLYLVLLYFCRWIFVGTVRFYLNYRYYKKLKHLPGYPSFLATNQDIFAKQIYITDDKPEPVKKSTPKNAIVMNIGYDGDKKEDKAWNAFDYMEETNDKSN